MLRRNLKVVELNMQTNDNDVERPTEQSDEGLLRPTEQSDEGFPKPTEQSDDYIEQLTEYGDDVVEQPTEKIDMLRAPANDYVMLYTTSSPIDFYANTHLIDASSESIVLTLPDITGIPGLPYNFKRIDFNESNTVTLVGTTGQTFDGEVSYYLTINDSVNFVSYADTWHGSDRKDAKAVTYTPEINSSWSPEPMTVQEAVDHVGHVVGTLAIRILQGTGSPEGVVTASPGFLYLNIVGGSGATLWVKESGTLSTTGWASVNTTPANPVVTPVVEPVVEPVVGPTVVPTVVPEAVSDAAVPEATAGTVPVPEAATDAASTKRWYFF